MMKNDHLANDGRGSLFASCTIGVFKGDKTEEEKKEEPKTVLKILIG